jgi:hypothetical protein
VAARRGGSLLLGRQQVFVEALQRVGHVQERVPFQADADEGRLHPREHPGDEALIDVADDPPVRLSLDEQLGDQAVLEKGDLRLLRSGADEDLLCHAWAHGSFARRKGVGEATR